MNAVLSLGLLLSLSCATIEPAREEAPPETSAERGEGALAETKLRYRLEAEESYRMGSAVAVAFTLENLSAEPLSVLTWYTPLEGLHGDIFRIRRDGEEVLYQGRLAKRGDPQAEEYVRIEPGDSVSAEVDLAGGYDLSMAGEYRVEFNGRIHDVAGAGAMLPRAQDEHRGLEIPGNAVVFRVIGP